MVNNGASGGCYACKQKRRKCDQTRPSCLRCSRASHDCPGYKFVLKFINYAGVVDSNLLHQQQAGLLCLSKCDLLPIRRIANRDERDKNSDENQKTLSLSIIRNPRDYLSCKERDTFTSYSIPATPYILELLQYWLTCLSSAFCTANEITNSVTPTLKTFQPLVISNAAMLHALLSFSSSMVDSTFGRKTPSTRTLEHMGSATRMINEALDDTRHATDDNVLLAICLLTGSHCIFRDYSYHELHVNGIHQIILLRGGIESLRAAPLIFRLILWADKFRGLYSNTPPRYRVASNLSESPSSAISITASQYLAAWSVRGIFSKQFIVLMAQITHLQQHIQSCRGTSISHSRLRDFSVQCGRIREDLIGSIAETYANPSEMGAYERCCLLAAALQFQADTGPFPIWSGVQVTLLQKLKDGLMKTDYVSCWGNDIELLLWVLIQAAVLDDPLKSWFSELLKHVLRAFGPKLSVEQLKDVLKRFLWSERSSGPACEKLYKEIQKEEERHSVTQSKAEGSSCQDEEL